MASSSSRCGTFNGMVALLLIAVIATVGWIIWEVTT